jgi:cyclic-di-GMP phosphodiesterase TipF (flagellum assembly factor)
MSGKNTFQSHTSVNEPIMPNKKGHGFRIFYIPQTQEKLRSQAIYGTIAGLLILSSTLIIIGKHATPDFIVLTCALMTLCSMTLYNILSRQIQDNDTEQRLDDLTRTQDRLVRHTARNRQDIETIKARKYDTAIMQGSVLNLTTPVAKKSGIIKFQAPPPAVKAMPKSRLEQAFQDDEKPYSDTVVAELIHHATSNDNIDLFMQPILALPQRSLQYYEVFGRIHAGRGQYLAARDYSRVAEKYNEDKQLDTILLIRTLSMLKTKTLKGGDNIPLMLNVSLRTITNRAFVNELIPFLARNRQFASRLIFEFAADDLGSSDGKILSLLEHLSKLGCRFSMDRVKSRKIDIVKLRNCSIRFIKLDAAWILRETRTKNGYSNVMKIRKQLEQSGIELIVEKIETEEQMRELLSLGISLGQGYLCGKPDINTAFIDTIKAMKHTNKEVGRHIQNKRLEAKVGVKTLSPSPVKTTPRSKTKKSA